GLRCSRAGNRMRNHSALVVGSGGWWDDSVIAENWQLAAASLTNTAAPLFADGASVGDAAAAALLQSSTVADFVSRGRGELGGPSIAGLRSEHDTSVTTLGPASSKTLARISAAPIVRRSLAPAQGLAMPPHELNVLALPAVPAAPLRLDAS